MKLLHAQLAGYGARLCCGDVCLPHQHVTWDCGYVNAAAVLGCVASRVPHAAARLPPKPILANADAPVRQAIQHLVTKAWRDDRFDPEGAQQQGFCMVGRKGKKAWLSPVEVVVLLWHLRVEAFLLEVVQTKGAGQAVYRAAAAWFRPPVADSDEPNTKRPRHHAELAEDPAHAARGCERLPWMLQHDGHSRLLVGVLTNPPRLLIRDPNREPTDANLSQVAVVDPKTLDGQQYEILVTGHPRGGHTGRLELPDAQASRRRGAELEPAAVWDSDKWVYSPWCELRF